ncbi:uncharacterized protein LOC116572116 isoform X2 [Mustela erminea]|uniref:uncharacterized protein LOC116572116 isoform X2 n=1 Tax=Mustela erminea TaxID=36723 RepID=UPI001386B329|nr:uncharacterized protein LOC116572116 isoform X2 [Mustela erminea]
MGTLWTALEQKQPVRVIPCWAEMAGSLSPTTTSQWIWVPQEDPSSWVLDSWNFLSARSPWTTPELKLTRFDHHCVAYQSILLRLKESQEGDLLATSLEEKQLNKELSRRLF